MELTRENMRKIYIPERCAHGFQTITDDVEMIYQHSEFYTPGCEHGFRYDDPAVAIQWPLPVSVISEKDKNQPFLAN